MYHKENYLPQAHPPVQARERSRKVFSDKEGWKNWRLATIPPKAVKSIRDLIFWQYAKIIAESAGMGKVNYGFIMSRFKKLQAGDIQWSSTIREWVREHENPNTCIYCETETPVLTTEHMLPRHRGGPDIPDNAVRACKACNSRKGVKRLYEWFGLDQRDDIPRIAEGKYLKLLYALHEERGTLDESNISVLCPSCDLEALCPEKATLNVFCLEGTFTPT